LMSRTKERKVRPLFRRKRRYLCREKWQVRKISQWGEVFCAPEGETSLNDSKATKPRFPPTEKKTFRSAIERKMIGGGKWFLTAVGGGSRIEEVLLHQGEKKGLQRKYFPQHVHEKKKKKGSRRPRKKTGLRERKAKSHLWMKRKRGVIFILLPWRNSLLVLK